MAKKKSPLTLHGLLVALSYWGTSVRLFIVTFVTCAVFAIALSETSGRPSAVSGEVITLIYLLASVFVLDFGYVMAARALPMQRALDVMSLVAADLILLGLYVVPKVTVTTTVNLVNPVGIVILIAILVLALRLLVGFLFSPKNNAA